MEKKKTLSIFKILLSILFGGAILGAYVYKLVKGDFNPAYLAFGCIAGCFVFSLIFLSKNLKKLFITLALACHVAADYFLVLNPAFDNAKLIGLCIFCGAQLFYFLYTLTLARGNGTRVVNVAIRVALCLLTYFIIPKYIAIGTIEMIAIMYFLNAAVSWFIMLLHIKTQWLTFIGFSLFLICDIYIGLVVGAFPLLGAVGEVIDWIYAHDFSLYTYIPGTFLIALSSVWATKKSK